MWISDGKGLHRNEIRMSKMCDNLQTDIQNILYVSTKSKGDAGRQEHYIRKPLILISAQLGGRRLSKTTDGTVDTDIIKRYS